jgi:hypothetical protein
MVKLLNGGGNDSYRNLKKYGTGVIINPSGIMNDGKFELVVLKNY